MVGELAVPLIIFLLSAGLVIYFGIRLAVYGDALASLTGWGRLFVGSILIALATSLPELSTNIAAVRLDPPNPDLALGTVLGANMYNMLKLSLVALIFGGKRFLEKIAPEQGYLVTLAVLLTGLTLLFGAVKMDISVWQVGLSSLILVVLFVLGMRVVYITKPSEKESEEEVHTEDMTLKRAWVMFLAVSLGVVVAGFFLAWSADRIAEVTGVASSTIGILAVSLVTSLPELSMAIAAARIGAADLAVAGLYGSNVFNISILFFADPFYRDGILVAQMEPAHFIVGGMAIGLMLVGLALIIARNQLRATMAAAVLVMMVLACLATAAAVGKVGGGDEERIPGTANARIHSPQQPSQ